jgi:hypothetical protein
MVCHAIRVKPRAHHYAGHLPFHKTYDSEYPEFLGKADIARGHQDYVRRYGIVSGWKRLPRC